MSDWGNRDADNTKGFALGMIVGALLGAGAALLLAPASGDETRRVLRRNARRLSARGSNTLGHVAEDAERAARQLARRGRKAAIRARDAAEALIDEGRRHSTWRS